MSLRGPRVCEHASTSLRLGNAEGGVLLTERKPPEAGDAFERGLAGADKDGIPPRTRTAPSRTSGSPARRCSRSTGCRAGLRESLAGPRECTRRREPGGGLPSAHGAQPGREPGRRAGHLDPAHGRESRGASPDDDLDPEKRSTWLATQHAVFAELTTLFATGAQQDESRSWLAFDASERGRARSLRYALNLASDERRVESGEPSSERYRELMQRIAIWPAQWRKVLRRASR